MSFFELYQGGRPVQKTHVHMGQLPGYIDPKQPPTRKSPWKIINDTPFVQGVSMILPEELYEVIWDKIEVAAKRVEYAKVIMKLQDVLDGDFFTEYVKKGK